MKLIDKDTVVAEIERRRDAALMRQRNLEAIGQETVLNEMVVNQLNRIISFIDTLEVKEINSNDVLIEKACDAYCKVCKMPNCRSNECKWISDFKGHLETI